MLFTYGQKTDFVTALSNNNSLEIITRIIADGPYLKTGFLSDAWNWLDVVAVSALFSLSPIFTLSHALFFYIIRFQSSLVCVLVMILVSLTPT